MKDQSNSKEQPEAVKLPPPAEPHPSEPAHVSYADPNAPKPKRKLHAGKLVALLLVFVVLAGGGVAAYLWYQNRDDESSAISNYSGGLAESEPESSVVTEETKAAKRFLQALQAGDAATVDELAAEALKQQVRQEAKSEEATVLAYYEGRFDGINFDSLISKVKDGTDASGTGGKVVSFSDASETYQVEALVIEDAGTLKISSVKSVFSY